MELTLAQVDSAGLKYTDQTTYSQSKGGITLSAIAHLFKLGKLDYVRIGTRRNVVLNDKAANYTPNGYKTKRIGKNIGVAQAA